MFKRFHGLLSKKSNTQKSPRTFNEKTGLLEQPEPKEKRVYVASQIVFNKTNASTYDSYETFAAARSKRIKLVYNKQSGLIESEKPLPKRTYVASPVITKK